jgi:hypothetical protein
MESLSVDTAYAACMRMLDTVPERTATILAAR